MGVVSRYAFDAALWQSGLVAFGVAFFVFAFPYAWLQRRKDQQPQDILGKNEFRALLDDTDLVDVATLQFLVSGDVRDTELIAYLHERGFDVPNNYGETIITRTGIVGRTYDKHIRIKPEYRTSVVNQLPKFKLGKISGSRVQLYQGRNDTRPGAAVEFLAGVDVQRDAEQIKTQIAISIKEARKNKVELTEFDGPMTSVIIGNPYDQDGWAQIEVYFPWCKSDNRPSILFQRKDYPELFATLITSFNQMVQHPSGVKLFNESVREAIAREYDAKRRTDVSKLEKEIEELKSKHNVELNKICVHLSRLEIQPFTERENFVAIHCYVFNASHVTLTRAVSGTVRYEGWEASVSAEGASVAEPFKELQIQMRLHFTKDGWDFLCAEAAKCIKERTGGPNFVLDNLKIRMRSDTGEESAVPLPTAVNMLGGFKTVRTLAIRVVDGITLRGELK